MLLLDTITFVLALLTLGLMGLWIHLLFGHCAKEGKRDEVIGYVLCFLHALIVTCVNLETMDSGIVNAGLDALTGKMVTDGVAPRGTTLLEHHDKNIVGGYVAIASERNNDVVQPGQTINILAPQFRPFIRVVLKAIKLGQSQTCTYVVQSIVVS